MADETRIDPSVSDDTEGGVEETPTALGASADRNPYAIYAMLLKLSYARSMWLVGEALAVKYPTEGAFEALLQSPEFFDAAESFAQIIDDIRSLGLINGLYDPAVVAEEAAKHHLRALEAIEPLLEHVEVDPSDLVAYLVG